MTSHVEGMEIQIRRVAILEEAKALVEKGWTQGHMAEDEDGNPVLVLAKSACRWCLHGAVFTAVNKHCLGMSWEEKNREARLVMGAVALYGLGELPPPGWTTDTRLEQFLHAWNDDAERQQDEVLRALAQTSCHVGSMVPGCLHN